MQMGQPDTVAASPMGASCGNGVLDGHPLFPSSSAAGSIGIAEGAARLSNRQPNGGVSGAGGTRLPPPLHVAASRGTGILGGAASSFCPPAHPVWMMGREARGLSRLQIRPSSPTKHPCLPPMGLLSVGPISGGGKAQATRGKVAVKVACGACGAQDTPPKAVVFL